MNCPKCGSDRITVERRPDGDCGCTLCGHTWKNSSEPILPIIQASEPENNLRYQLVQGKYGFYFHDSVKKDDMTLEKVLAVLNDHEKLRLQHSLLVKDFNSISGEPQV